MGTDVTKRAVALMQQLTTAASQVAATAVALGQLLAETTADATPREKEYVSVKELVELIPYREQTIRNLMSAGVLRHGVHYYRRRGRVVFVWSAVQTWLRERSADETAPEAFIPVHHARTRKVR
jgi:uncharacterized protein YheU (UPF0270 family)